MEQIVVPVEASAWVGMTASEPFWSSSIHAPAKVGSLSARGSSALEISFANVMCPPMSSPPSSPAVTGMPH